MKSAFALCLVLLAEVAASAQTAGAVREMQFTGPAAAEALCDRLLEEWRIAEAQGRLDFAIEVTSAGTRDSAGLTARISTGSTYAVGRIDFEGHATVNDATLRRALTIHERDALDVRKLRRSLVRINGLGVFEPLTLGDVSMMRRQDGVTADLTIQLRERKRRWWSLSGPMLPGIALLQASLASRLPPWGRGIFEAATYFVSLNITAFARPFLVIERPVLPGQEWLSGFAISPSLSPRGMLMHYGRTHLADAIGTHLDGDARQPLAVTVTSVGQREHEPLVCKPPTPRSSWLRRSAATVVSAALAALIP